MACELPHEFKIKDGGNTGKAVPYSLLIFQKSFIISMFITFITSVKIITQLFYILAIFGILYSIVLKLKSHFLQYQFYYGLSISSSNLNLVAILVVFLYLTTGITSPEVFCGKKELCKQLITGYSTAAENKNTLELVKLLCNHPFETRSMLESGELGKILGGKPSFMQQAAKNNTHIKLLYSHNFMTIPSEAWLKVNTVLSLGKPCFPIGDWGLENKPAHQIFGDFCLSPENNTLTTVSCKALQTSSEGNWLKEFSKAPESSQIQILNKIPEHRQESLQLCIENQPHPKSIELIDHRNFTDEEILRYIRIMEEKFKTTDLYTSYMNNNIISLIKNKSLIVVSKEDYVRSLDI